MTNRNNKRPRKPAKPQKHECNGVHKKKERTPKIAGHPAVATTLKEVAEASALAITSSSWPYDSSENRFEVRRLTERDIVRRAGLKYLPISRGEHRNRPFVVVALMLPQKGWHGETQQKAIGEGLVVSLEGREHVLTEAVALVAVE